MYWLRTYEYGVHPVLEWHRTSAGRGMPPTIDKVSYTDEDNDSGKFTDFFCFYLRQGKAAVLFLPAAKPSRSISGAFNHNL